MMSGLSLISQILLYKVSIICGVPALTLGGREPSTESSHLVRYARRMSGNPGLVRRPRPCVNTVIPDTGGLVRKSHSGGLSVERPLLGHVCVMLHSHQLHRAPSWSARHNNEPVENLLLIMNRESGMRAHREEGLTQFPTYFQMSQLAGLV